MTSGFLFGFINLITVYSDVLSGQKRALRDGAAFLPHSVETEVKGIFPGAGPWVFRLVSIRSSASLRDRGQLELG